MELLRHRLTVLIGAVLVLGASVLIASLGSHHAAKTPTAANQTADPTDAPPAASGWRWAVAHPGYHLGEYGNRWNVSALTPRDVPAGAGVLASMRPVQGVRADLLYAQKSCVGVQLMHGPRKLLCPPNAPVVLIANAHMVAGQGKPFYSFYLLGVVRSDVTKVTVDTPGERYVDATSGVRVVKQMPPQVVYTSGGPGPWGSLQLTTGQPKHWLSIVTVYGLHGKLATLRLEPARAGEYTFCPGATGNACS